MIITIPTSLNSTVVNLVIPILSLKSHLKNITEDFTTKETTNIFVTSAAGNFGIDKNLPYTEHIIQETKPFHCGVCSIAAFADSHRLTHHLKTCGKENSFKCNQCGDMYSDQKSLSTHVTDHHEKKERRCPICPNKVYTSEGGYYNHMRTAHQVGCKDQKLKEVLQNNEDKESSEEENNAEISDGSGEDESKKKNQKPISAKGTKSKGDNEW